MTFGRVSGGALVAAAGGAAWLGYAGHLLPRLDALASFMPIFGLMAIVGLVLGRPVSARAVLGVVVALAPVALAVAPEFVRTIPTASGTSQLRLVTHNVWRDNDDPARTAQTIIDARPDLVLLQEVDGRFRPMLPLLERRLGRATRCPPGCDHVIISRWPILASGYFIRDGRGRKVRPPLLWARIAAPDGRIFTVVTVHYPRPTSPLQAAHRHAVTQALRWIHPVGLIVAGDMNLTPWSAALRAQDRSFVPLTRMTRAIASWPRVFPVLPIDQVYAGPAWGLVSAHRLGATGSDHYPLLTILARR